MLNTSQLKKQFPIFERSVNGKPLVYLDNASTTQKPRRVIDALVNYYETMNANIHRGVHTVSEEATAAYEGVREKVAGLIGASEPAEIIFTRNATEALNLIAYSIGEQKISSGDGGGVNGEGVDLRGTEVVVSALEHHSNLVPWQQLCRRKGANLKNITLKPENTIGELDLSSLEKIITDKCKIVAVTMMSNVLGGTVPVEKIIARAREVGALVVIDAAQAVAHMGIDVKKLDCDFLAFSAHKMFGPTGVGVLYGKRAMLENMSPFLFGGDMVKEVTDTDANWNDLPWKFEAGTPNIADVIAFGAAIDFLQQLDMKDVQAHEEKLVKYAWEKLQKLEGLQIYGAPTGSIVSFNVPGVHPHDVATILNEAGVAVRAGHHCAQPLMQKLGVVATTRMSFSIYNDESDVDTAVDALKNVYKIFKI